MRLTKQRAWEIVGLFICALIVAHYWVGFNHYFR